jgi:hypothetical protein
MDSSWQGAFGSVPGATSVRQAFEAVLDQVR